MTDKEIQSLLTRVEKLESKKQNAFRFFIQYILSPALVVVIGVIFTYLYQKEKNEIDRVKRLEKENARLRQENDLLKKWQRFLAEEHQNDLDSSKDMGKT